MVSGCTRAPLWAMATWPLKSICQSRFGAAASKRIGAGPRASSPPSGTPFRRRTPVTVEGAIVIPSSRASTRAILRPPQAGCSVRTATTAASTAPGVRPGELSGRRDCSTSAALPPASKRTSHL